MTVRRPGRSSWRRLLEALEPVLHLLEAWSGRLLLRHVCLYDLRVPMSGREQRLVVIDLQASGALVFPRPHPTAAALW